MSQKTDSPQSQPENSLLEIQIQEELDKNPLNFDSEMDSAMDTSAHRQNMRNFFDSIDVNNDGAVQIHELQQFMGNFLDPSLAKYIANQLHKKYDKNSDGMLSFDEFYEMSLRKDYKFHRLLFRYCKYVVPQKQISLDESYDSSISFCPPPLAMISFSIVQATIYAICLHSTKGEYTICDSLKYDPYRRSEIWRFLSYMFVHTDFGHIFGNLILQIFLGLALELVHQWWRVSLVYVAGVLAGSLGHSLTNTNSLAGASAGVYALITAHIATVVMNWEEMVHPGFQLILILIYCLTDGYYSFNDYYYYGNRSIGYVAHLCGAVAGLLVGIRVLRNLKVHKWERMIWRCSVLLFCILMFMGIVANIFFYDSMIGTKVNEPNQMDETRR